MIDLKKKLAATALALAMVGVAAPAATAAEADDVGCRDIFADRICDVLDAAVASPKALIEEIKCRLNPDCPWG